MYRKLIIKDDCMKQYNIREKDEIIYDRETCAMRGELAVAIFEQSRYYGIYEGTDEDGCEMLRFLNGRQILLDQREGYTRIGKVIAVFRWELGRFVDVKDDVVARARFLKITNETSAKALLISQNELGVFASGEKIWVSSRDVASKFEKSHDKVLRSIRTLDCSEEFTAANFGVSEYKDPTGRTLPQYLMTRDGFTFLAMGFTGPKAARFKELYIAEFNRMEEELYRRRFSAAGSREEVDRLTAQCETERKRAATAIGHLRTARASEEKMKHQLNKALDIIARLTA